MKKTRSLIAVLVALALLVSVFCAFTAGAAEEDTVSSTLDFSTLTANEDKTAVAEAIKGLGAVDCSNLKLDNHYTVCAHPGGYAGEGYYVQKLEAGEGKVFDGAPVFSLTYRLTTADPMGYIKIQGSVDGANWYDFAQYTESTGSPYGDPADVAVNASVTLNGAENASVVYVKVLIQHWGCPDAGCVDKSSLTARVKADPDAKPANYISSRLDFSAMTKTDETESACAAIKAAGAVDAVNLKLGDCYSVLATPNGGYEEGYYIQKLDAGEGKVFEQDPALTITFWCAQLEDPGYVKIMQSADSESWTEAYAENTGFGDEWQTTARKTETVTLTGLAGSRCAYIKVIINRHAGETSGAVVCSEIVATVVDAPEPEPTETTPVEPEPTETTPVEPEPTETTPVEPEPTEPTPTEPTPVETKPVSAKLDFSGLTATEDKSAAAEAIKGLGVLECSNLMLADHYTVCVHPGGYAGEGYFIWKMDAGKGKSFVGNVSLKMLYRLTTADPMGYIKIQTSTDGVTWNDLTTLNKAVGEPFGNPADVAQTCNATISGTDGATSVYVKVSIQHWGCPDAACVDNLSLSGKTRADADAKPGKAVSSVVDFSALTKTTDVDKAIEAMKKAGIVDASGLQLDDCYTVIATPKDGYADTWYIQTLSAGKNMVFQGDPVLNLTYWFAKVSDPGYLKVLVSTDGENYQEVYVQTEGSGEEYQTSARTSRSIPLTGAAGSGKVYVKVMINRHGGPTSGAVVRSEISGSAVSTVNDASGDAVGLTLTLFALCAVGFVLTARKVRS